MDETTTPARLLREPLILALACAVVGVLAARGAFSSISNFPLVFALVCLGFGLLSLRRQPRSALGRRLAVILLGLALAVAGHVVHLRAVERSLAVLQAEIAAEIVGRDAPALTGLQSLNVEPTVLEQAASYAHPATIVTFWARWCSPCWKELPELDELYRRRSADGLAVVALTRYDEPDDEAAMASQFARDREVVRKHGLTFPAAVTTDPGVHEGFRVRPIPSSALVDGKGKIVAYGVGLDGGRELMRRASELLDGG